MTCDECDAHLCDGCDVVLHRAKMTRNHLRTRLGADTARRLSTSASASAPASDKREVHNPASTANVIEPAQDPSPLPDVMQADQATIARDSGLNGDLAVLPERSADADVTDVTTAPAPSAREAAERPQASSADDAFEI